MLFRNTMRKYMSPETGGEGSGGGGDNPAPTPNEDPKPTEEPKPTGEPNEDPKPKSEEPKPQETNLPPKEEDQSKLGQVTSLVEAAGLSMKDVAEIAKANDGSIDLDTMVALKEKHGDAIASLIADQIKGIHTERVADANKRDQEVYDQVHEAFKDITSDPNQTGESMWKELSGWAKENVSSEHRADLNKMLAQGGLAAKLAVQELTTAFKESIGTQEFQEADLIDGDATPKGEGGHISKSDYNRELNALLAKGHVYGESREIAKLDARRSKSIARGM